MGKSGSWLDHFGERDAARAFPPPDSPAFLNSLRKNWADPSFLVQAFRSKRNRPDKTGLIVLWICLCLDRPWSKGWKFSVTYKMLYRVDRILKENSISAEIPSLSTFQKRLRQPKAKEKIMAAALAPELKSLAEAFAFMLKPLFSKPKIKRAFRIKLRFCDLVHKGPISQRDLMRKLRVSKNEMDDLVEWAGDDIELRKGPRGAVDFCDGFRPETAVNDRRAQESRRGRPSSPACP